MQNYQKLYTIMFNAATHAQRHLNEADFAAARAFLVPAQRQTENMYMAQEEADEARETEDTQGSI